MLDKNTLHQYPALACSKHCHTCRGAESPSSSVLLFFTWGAAVSPKWISQNKTPLCGQNSLEKSGMSGAKRTFQAFNL